MKPLGPFGTIVRSRLDALIRDVPAVRKGSAGALHRTRVASRRMREALPFLDLEFATLDLGRVRRTTRGLTRVLGDVRELDVALTMLDELSTTGPERQRVIERVRASIRHRRDRRVQAMLRDLRKLEPERLVAELFARQTADDSSDETGAWRIRLTTRLTRRSQRVRESIGNAGVIFVPERLHAVRISLKKLRYGLELAHETGLASTSVLAKRLKIEQERLGRLHDLEVLSGLIVRVREEAPPGATADELDTVVDELGVEARRLHGQFVAGRDDLMTICARIEEIGARTRAGDVADAS